MLRSQTSEKLGACSCNSNEHVLTRQL